MEPPSHLDAPPPTEIRTSLESQLREMYGRVAYTHKAHEKMADGYVGRYKVVKNLEIAMSAIATGSLLIAVFGDSRPGTILGAVLSTVLLGFTLYFKEAALGEQGQKHTVVAARLWGIRERLLSVLVDLSELHDLEAVRSIRDKINVDLEDLYKNAPRTSSRAYAAAQRALKSDDELYFSDAELDRLLPKKLRIGPGDAPDE
jgi:SMODS and SLOG-associating 2TM effector domain family 4